MTHESPAQGRASADALNVENESSGGGGHDGTILTAKQRGRWSPLTVEGILARSAKTAQAHDLAMALGKVMRRDGTFNDTREGNDLLCVEIRPIHRDKVQKLLELSPWSWGEYVREWQAAGLGHRCTDLQRGSVRLFREPMSACPICGSVALGNDECGPQQRSTLPTATEFVLNTGDASGDEEGDVPSQRSTNGDGTRAVASRFIQQPSEVAAHVALKRAGVEIGEPMSDEEIRALGYRRTSRGWVPIKGATDAA